MADPKEAAQRPGEVSGVIPVAFSASAEAHDDAVVVSERDATWRTPFATERLRPASGE
jgi:hypothetical protein